MTTTTRASLLKELVNLDSGGVPFLDPCGVPFADGPAGPASYAPLPGLSNQALIATVQRIEPARYVEPLVWAIADGQTILFRVDDATLREMTAALAAGEAPTAIVEPCQIVSRDINP